MVKIAVEVERALAERAAHGVPGRATPRRIAQGEGWTVSDVICTCGPHDRSFEEQHASFAIALVTAGSFQYHASHRKLGRSCELMTPGSLLFGQPGQCFECKHEHGAGDRCLSFGFSSEYLERIAIDTGAGSGDLDFGVHLPPLRVLSPLVARACAALAAQGQRSAVFPWEELGLELAASVLQLMAVRALETLEKREIAPSTLARVTRTLRTIEREPGAAHTLETLAREARLSPYHFLRAFRQVTGVTPHQYVLRLRLREAAVRLANEPERILAIALDCGFGDVSNFNRAFRSEFGSSPRDFRRKQAAAYHRAAVCAALPEIHLAASMT